MGWVHHSGKDMRTAQVGFFESLGEKGLVCCAGGGGISVVLQVGFIQGYGDEMN